MDKEDDKALREAIASKNTQMIKIIYHYKPQIYDDKYFVDQLLKHKWSLCNVVKLRKPHITKLLLESDDSINVNEHDEDDGDWTALHEAAYNIDVDHVQLLLDHKADPNSLDIDCRTPLDYPYDVVIRERSDYKDRFKIVNMLIDKGAKPIITRDDINYFQFEHILVGGNSEEVERVLKLLDMDLRVSNDCIETVLHFLARNEHPQIVTMIRGRNFDVNARNEYHQTPCFQAAECGHLHSIKFLLSQGADVNIADTCNSTPLFAATYFYKNFVACNTDEYKKCIALLLECGADVQIASTQNNMLVTVFDLAILGDNEDCYLYRLMLEHLALQEANGAKITELIQSKIDISSSSKEYYKHCKMLLAKKVYGSETTLKLLSCSQEKLVPYMRNEEMVRIINDFSNELKLISVAYGDLLQKRFEKAKGTAKLRGEVGLVISKLIGVDYDCYFSIVDMIVRFLNEPDLNTLLNISL